MTRPLIPMEGEITRDLGIRWRGHDLVARMSVAGIAVKGKGRGFHWSRAFYLSWASLFDIAAELRAQELINQRSARRGTRKRQGEEGRQR